MQSKVSGRILIVEDDDDLRHLLETGLTSHGFVVHATRSAETGLAAFKELSLDVLLVDLNLPGMSGLEMCAHVVGASDAPVVLMTAFASIKSAVEAMRAGAYDFILKPLDVDAVAMRLARIVRERRIAQEAKRLRDVVHPAGSFGGLAGSSPPMQRVYDLLTRSAPAEASVLVTGESGTGKELAARALHEHSSRKDGPFIALNCSAVPEQLIESELFGHSKGAFTDARNDRMGLFSQANGGTLFLDEVGEIPMAMQAKLLRALEERVVRPIGSNHESPIDVRIVAATNRDLEAAAEQGRFREDLYFRINVIHVRMPPLRARGTDVLQLAQHFLRRFSEQEAKDVGSIAPVAAQRLCDYEWPGNVRELRNCMERAVALTRFNELSVEDLPDRVRSFKRSHVVVAADDPSELVPLEEVERRYIKRVLEAVGGSKTAASKILGLDRKTLYRRLERYKKADG